MGRSQDQTQMGVTCTGRGTADGDHCCYIGGVQCLYLEEPRGRSRRKFVCGLRATLGSWQAVNLSAEYEPIGTHWQSIGLPYNYCETYQPGPGLCCREAR